MAARGAASAAPLEARPHTSPFVGRARELGAAPRRVRRRRGASGRRGGDRRRAGRDRQVAARARAIGAIGADATVLAGAAVATATGVTYRPLARDRRAARRSRAASPRARAGRLIARTVLAAVGRIDGAAQTEETFWAVRRMFEGVAAERPLVVVVEDIHWAEPTLLDLLDYLVAFSTGTPILLVCLDAPGAARVAGPPGRRRSAGRSVLVLDALSDERGARARRARRRRCARGAAHRGDRARATRCSSSSSSRSAATTDDAAADDPGGAGRAHRPSRRGRARAARARRRSRAARSHRGALAALLRGRRAGTATRLTALVRKQLIRADRSGPPGDDGFRFAHALIREVAYRGLPKRRRAELHERLAGGCRSRPTPRTRWSATTSSARGATGASSGSGDEALAEEAAQRLGARRAAPWAGRRGRRGRLLERAAALRPGDEALLLPLGVALFEAGRIEDATRVLDDAIERASDPRAEARARVERELVRLHAEPGAGTAQPRLAVEDALRLLEYSATNRRHFFGGVGGVVHGGRIREGKCVDERGALDEGLHPDVALAGALNVAHLELAEAQSEVVGQALSVVTIHHRQDTKLAGVVDGASPGMRRRPSAEGDRGVDDCTSHARTGLVQRPDSPAIAARRESRCFHVEPRNARLGGAHDTGAEQELDSIVIGVFRRRPDEVRNRVCLVVAGLETDAKRRHRAQGEDGGQKRESASAKPPAPPGDAECVCRFRESEDLLDARIVELVGALRVVAPSCALPGVPRSARYRELAAGCPTARAGRLTL